MTGQSAARWLGRLGAALLLGGCALLADPSRVAVGTPQAQLRQELGAPTATYPAAGGAGFQIVIAAHLWPVAGDVGDAIHDGLIGGAVHQRIPCAFADADGAEFVLCVVVAET